MKKIFFFFTATPHPLDIHKMDSVPEGYIPLKSPEFADPFAEESRKSRGERMKHEIFQNVLNVAINVYNNSRILLNSPKKRNFLAKDADMVSSSQALLDTNVPYVMDMEHPAVFCGFNQYGLDSKSFSKSLKKELENENLRKIMPMSDTAKQTLFNFVRSEKIAE
ncbi:MAG: hypothetical protein NTY68_03225, partial [Candidatus Micrarchaeota archaeon]|nr:hypothetical protein [Candidatus Micrarchaeota archaeon]